MVSGEQTANHLADLEEGFVSGWFWKVGRSSQGSAFGPIRLRVGGRHHNHGNKGASLTSSKARKHLKSAGSGDVQIEKKQLGAGYILIRINPGYDSNGLFAVRHDLEINIQMMSSDRLVHQEHIRLTILDQQDRKTAPIVFRRGG